MPDRFDDRIDHLITAVGRGKIRAGNVVRQPYAADVHEDLPDKHPRGGRAKYLEGPLFEQLPELMQALANKVLTPGGSDIRGGMIDVAEDMADMVERNAPVKWNILRYSSNPYVEDNNFEIYGRTQLAPYQYGKTDQDPTNDR